MRTQNTILNKQQQSYLKLNDGQIEALLNDLLFSAIKPLFVTSFFKNEISIIMLESYNNKRFKLSYKDDRIAILCLFKIIASQDPEKILLYLKKANLDRSILQYLIDKFLKLASLLISSESDYYRSLNNNTIDYFSSKNLNNLELFFNLPSSQISFLYKDVDDKFNYYLKVKEKIASAFYLFAYKSAFFPTRINQENIDRQCLFKNLLLAIDTALNKYSSSKGTLSSYVKLWFKSYIISPKYNYEMGKPFYLDSYAKKICKNHGIDLEAVPIESEDFEFLESFSYAFKENVIKLKEIDEVLLNHINSIKDSRVDLVKIILSIPKIKKSS